MLGIKEKITKFIDGRVEAYLKYKQQKNKVEGTEITEADISMAEAELKKIKESLDKALGYSFQRDFDSLSYVKNGKQVAMDSIDNQLKGNKMCGMSGMIGSPKDIIFSFFAKFGYIGWQICAVLGQHWLISKACNIANKDCLRNGWNNIFIDKKDKDESEEEKEKNQEILNNLYEIEQQEYNLNEKLLKWGFYINVFGTAFLLPKIDGIDYDKPYNPDGIKKGSFKGLAVIEPYWMIPEFDLDNMMDVTDINFFEPEYYRTNKGERIHKSHLIIGRRKYVSDILKPSYYYGGISLAQEMYERVYASERSANEAPLLLLTKRLNVYKTKLKNVFANPQHYKDLMEVITEMRDNQGILFADMDDDVSQIDTTLSDLDEVIMKQYQIASAIAEVPVDKLFETNPTGGLSASGDYNIKNYNQNLNTLQTGRFKPAIDRANEIIMRSKFDKKDRVGIVFNPTDNPTEKEIADLNKQKADVDTIYIQNGIITPEEARQRLVNDKTSGYGFLKGVEMEEPSEEEQQDIESMMKGIEEQKEGKDEDDIEWITVNGVHIPVKEGENKEEIIKKFIESKKEDNGGEKKKEETKTIEKESKKDYNISEKKEQSNKNQQKQSEVSKNIIDFASSRDDKSVNRDKVLKEIKDFSYEYKGKKYNYSKEQIQKMVNDVEEKIERKKEDTTIKRYLKEIDGKKVWDEDRVKKHHDRILFDIFKNAKKSDNPELIVLGGRGGSGKSRFIKKEGFVVLDSDEIKKQLPEYDGWNTAQLHEEAGHILKRAMDIAMEGGISVVLDNTLHGKLEKLKGRIQPFIDKKYKLQMHYIHLPRQKSVQNSISRWLKGNVESGKGRYVPIDAILDMTDNEENFTKLVEAYNPSQYSFSTNDVKEGEGTKYLYGNMKDGGKSLWRKI